MARRMLGSERVRKMAENPYTQHVSTTQFLFTKAFKEEFWHCYTEVCFVGRPQLAGQMRGFESLYNLFGNEQLAAVSFYETYRNYYQYVLNLPILICSKEDHEKITSSDRVKEIPAYPAEGSIQWIDDVLVVKLS